MTIPSALTLLVNTFPDPHQQARAIGLFGGAAGIANSEDARILLFMTSLIVPLVLGLLIGAMFVEWATYHWVFWFVAIVAVPVALAGVFIIPPQIAKAEPEAARWKTLDLIGVSILTGTNIRAYPSLHLSPAPTVALILFIFAVTSGSTDGWASAIVLAPLVISVSMMVGFFYWETLVPAEKAAMYVIWNTRVNFRLILYQTTPNMVLQ
jgi:MFS family permease